MTARTCSLCDKPVDPGFRPFCSKRCADLDLHRWLSGSYVIAGFAEEEEEGDGAAPRRSDGLAEDEG